MLRDNLRSMSYLAQMAKIESGFLFDNKHLILIDVSQSVKDDHLLALEFLKQDLRYLNHY